jgi:hypothetical protein
MKSSLQFDDYDWRNGSASAYGDSGRGVVMVEYDDNLLFDDEVVGQAISWPDSAPPPPFSRAISGRAKSRRK